MTVKRFTLFALVSAILAALALVVSAQDSQGRGFKQGRFGFGPNGSSILEVTGLESEAALWEALKDGSTIAELIEANGGDVDSVIAELVAAAADDINARMAAMLETLEADITAQLHSGLGRFEGGKGRPMPRGGFGLRGMEAIILEATGLESEAALREALKDGSTIAELIEANDSDVDSVIAELVAAATDDINARVAAMLEADITAQFRGGLGRFEGGKGRPMPRGGFGLRGMGAIVLEATGLESEAALREALQDGSTIAELIEANGGDVDSVIAELTDAVTEDINAAAAAKLETLEADITTRIHSRFERVGFRGFGFWRMDKAKEA